MVNSKIVEIRQNIQSLIDYQMKVKENNAQLLKQLFIKRDNIKEMENVENMPDFVLNAYLIYKRAWYSNWQEKHLSVNNFDKDGYLEKLEKEIELIKIGQINELYREIALKISTGELNVDELLGLLKNEKKLNKKDDIIDIK